MSHGSGGPTPSSSTTPSGAHNAKTADAAVSKARTTDPTVELPEEAVQKALAKSLRDSSLPVKPPLMPEGYQITRKLGEGTYGEVWRGRQVRTGVQVAVKFLRARTRAQLQLLGEEAKKLAMLHSEPRIVHLIDVEETTTPPYFIMDYAEHGSLADRLDRGPLPLAEAITIFREVVEAMAYVHAKGIRHCDLKPGNILLDAADRPRIADFGQSHLSVEPTKSALGTFFYMAPEQAATEHRVPDARWDVFGLGALLYAMVTGAPPRFDSDFKNELEKTAELSHRLERYRQWVETSPAPSAHRAVKGMDRALADIIDRCLAADPADRYASAAELLAALHRRERRRRKRPLVLFGIVAPLLLVTGLGVAGLYIAHRTSDASKQAEQAFKEHKKSVDLMTAHLLAFIVEDKLQDMRDKVTVLARNESLKTAFQNHLTASHAHDEKASEDSLAQLEEWLRKVGAYENQLHLIAVFDTGANLRAAWMRTADKNDPRRHPREIYGKNYAYRDYWNHETDDYGAPPRLAASAAGLVASPLAPGPLLFASAVAAGAVEPRLPGHICHCRIDIDADNKPVPYVGQPYTSTVNEKFTAITVSLPIYRKDEEGGHRWEFAGLLVAALKLDKFNEWLSTVEKSPREMAPSVVLLDSRGYCVHHGGVDRAAYEPPEGKSPERRYDPVGAGTEKVAPHQDPYDGKPYTAAFVPVGRSGWSVIFQYDPQDKMSQARDTFESRLNVLIVVAVALSLTLLVVFYGWLVWTLLRKETGTHG
jgi:serine/threonine protein kinase